MAFDYTHTTPVNSSWIDKIFYDEETRKLVVVIGGYYYGYSGVSLTTYLAFMDDTSGGSFYSRQIKGVYTPFYDFTTPFVKRSVKPEVEESELEADAWDSTYRIDFTIEGDVELHHMSGDIMGALDKFVKGMSKDGYTVRVRSIKEIV